MRWPHFMEWVFVCGFILMLLSVAAHWRGATPAGNVAAWAALALWIACGVDTIRKLLD